MRGFLIALQFLTILPLEIKSEIKEKDFGRALIYFPVVGALIGLILALLLLALDFLPNLAKIALVLTSSIIITGAIHLDGFADTCDGFCSAKSKEKILNIMHDPRIGSMGVIAVVSLLLLKFTLMASISKDLLWKSLIMMSVFSRWSQVMACNAACYARQEGKARYFIEYSRKRDVFIGGIFTLVLFLLLMPLKGFILFALSLITVFLFLCFIKKKIDGMTGDTIGAVNEVTEVGVLLFSLILSRIPVW